MGMQIEISQRRGRNMHIVMRGRSGDEASLDDSEVFAKHIEVCQAFAQKQTPLPEVLEDAFDALEQTSMMSLASH